MKKKIIYLFIQLKEKGESNFLSATYKVTQYRYQKNQKKSDFKLLLSKIDK